MIASAVQAGLIPRAVVEAGGKVEVSGWAAYLILQWPVVAAHPRSTRSADDNDNVGILFPPILAIDKPSKWPRDSRAQLAAAKHRLCLGP